MPGGRSAVHHLREGALRIEVGDDDVRVELVAVFQGDADGGAVANEDLLDAGLRADFAAVFGQGAGECLGDRPHATARQAPGADVAVHVAHHVVQQDVGGARGVHAEGRADDPGAGHRRLDQLVLEVVLEKVRGAHGEEADVLVELTFAEVPELLRQPQHLQDVPGPERARVRRCAQQGLADQLRVAPEIRLEARHRIRIVGRVAAQFQVGRLLVRVVDERTVTAVAEVHGAEIGHQQQAVAREVEVAVNRLAHHRAHVGAAGVEPALVHLPGHRRPADVVVLLDHQHAQARLGEVRRRREAVVAGADHDRIVVAHDRLRRIARAALRPGLPVRSPPGWLPAPHRYRPSIGVRYWAAS
jgi:hypothetical protein